MEKIIDLAKKLKTLADRGVDGEKVNARVQLERIMKKHNLTIEDIEGEKKDYHEFAVDEVREQIFSQIVSSVVGKDYQRFSKKGKPKVAALLCTASEAVEIEMKYDFYWKLYQEELKIFRHAFFQRNDIYPKDSEPLKILDEKEMTRMRRVLGMAENIKRGELLRQLANPKL